MVYNPYHYHQYHTYGYPHHYYPHHHHYIRICMVVCMGITAVCTDIIAVGMAVNKEAGMAVNMVNKAGMEAKAVICTEDSVPTANPNNPKKICREAQQALPQFITDTSSFYLMY
ncbi:hypothetical protein [Paenibacillus piri]|uniref:hypothetical protein n=1 Tax=Paenibacillus piri TaxID=2547395 RepID=UPI00140455CE|nr:hypothetical protein [Paenibacillus piri]